MKFFRVLLFSLIGVFIASVFLALHPKPLTVSADEEVSISVSGFGTGSLIPMTSSDQPVVDITSYKAAGPANLTLYQASEEIVFKSLLRNKDNKAINKIDVSNLPAVAKETITLKDQTQQNKISLPLSESGIWVLRITYSGKDFDYLINRSKSGVLVKNADQKYLFWAQNFKTRKASSGNLKIYSLLNSLKELSSTNFDEQGIAQTPLLPDADIGVAKFGDDIVVFPINLHNLNSEWDYRSFTEQKAKPIFFIFTDRPVYKPGDIVYFKAVTREDDDAFYSIPKGNAKVKIIKDYEETPIIIKDFPVSEDGTVFGEYKTSVDAPTGYYEIEINLPDEETKRYTYGNRASFQLEHFRKPEYNLDLNTDKLEFIPPDKASVKVSANYFFGQPVSQKNVKYSISSSNFYQFEHLQDQEFSVQDNFIYGYNADAKVASSTLLLDKKGQAAINFTVKIPTGENTYNDPYYQSPTGRNQVFSINVLLDDGSGNPAFASKNVLVYAGEFDIYRLDRNYSSKVGENFKLPLKLVPHFKANVSSVKINAQIHRVNWIPDPDSKDKYQKYKKEEEDLPAISIVTDQNGEANLSINPQKVGLYTFKVEAFDKRGNVVVKNFTLYVSSDNNSYNFTGHQSNITISADKDKYLPSEKAQLTIFSQIPDSDILLTFERGRVRRYQVLHLKGNSIKVDAQLVDSDIPNVTAVVSAFLNNDYQINSKDLLVSAQSKKVIVKLKTDRDKYGPSEIVQLSVSTEDNLGNPTSADVAVWAIDKAIYELTSSKPPDIFDHFWHERYNSTSTSHFLEGINAQFGGGGGGCFDGQTQILMADGKYKRIDQIKVGDPIKTWQSDQNPSLTSSKVLAVTKIEVDGYMIINGHFRVTPEHKLWINNTWKEAGSIQMGDFLADSSGKEVQVVSIEWLKGKFEVYNLQTEKHTFIADNFYVHNDKGGARTVFKDTAYWNPTVHTDQSGQAKVSFKLPDNLTTWLISAIADTKDTHVGQVNSEIIVSKDIFIRPIIPNILRTSDKAYLSAIIHNFTNKSEDLTVNLESDTLKIGGGRQVFNLSGNDLKQVFWPIQAQNENDKAKLTFSVFKDNKLLDSATVQLPIRAFGFFEKKVQTAEGSTNYPLQLSDDTDKSKAKISLDLSPTILGSTISSFKYLISYPYGCVEQTTSRLVPALMAKISPNIFSSIGPIDTIIKDSIKRLSNLQTSYGWGWWQSQSSSHFVTSYVLEQLLLAKNNGYFVDEATFKKAKTYLEQDTSYNNQTQQYEPLSSDKEVARIYGLTLLGSEKIKLINSFDNLTADILSLAVLSNIKNGNKNADLNGFNFLMSLQKQQGDVKYFEAGFEENFGSNLASTALAIRAMIAQGLDYGEILPFVKYLTINKNGDFYGNTFATSQTIKAIADYAKITSETNPDFSYSANLDGNIIKRGQFSSIEDKAEVLDINKDLIKSPSSINLEKQGQGSLYSTLTVEEFNTSKNNTAKNDGLFITREYINSTGGKTISIGDTIIVKLTVGGLNTLSHYAVIKDELPAGLIPINSSFSNEYYYLFNEPNPTPTPSPEPYGITDQEILENGMILSLYQIDKGTHTYTYKARAVVKGSFSAPPAQVELMYNPKVSGRSNISTLEIEGESQLKQIRFEIEKFIQEYGKYLGILALAVLFASAAIIVFRRMKKSKSSP